MIKYFLDRFSDCVFELEYKEDYTAIIRNKKNTSIEFKIIMVQPEKFNRFFDMLEKEFDIIEIK